MQQGISSKLDWSRMLGFEQVAAERTVNAKLGSKVGGKPAISAKVGVKIGTKPGFKPTT
jgi:hypothetical protein